MSLTYVVGFVAWPAMQGTDQVRGQREPSPEPIEVTMLSRDARFESDLMERVSALANEVYAVAEAGLWMNGATRTSIDEIVRLTDEGEIAVCRMGGRIVGCVRLQRLDEHTGEFGMLCADPAHRGIGIGRELIRFAEQRFQSEGRSVMQLELLVPRDWTHPSKEFLAEWYSRIGYKITRTGTIDEAYPELAPLLATPCDFVIYRKDLTGDPLPSAG
jgi:ribosomal protein S18 acetylase RimI-like enzyme